MANKVKHTRTPWRIDKYHKIVDKTGESILVYSVALPMNGPCVDVGKANAEFIVRAVNNHATLLAALERIAIVPCNCANDALPGDECESCIARAAIAAATK